MESIYDIIKRNTEISDESMIINKGLYQDATFDGKSYNFNSRYYKLYQNYKTLLDRYLVEKFSLKVYDDMVSDSDLLFIPIKEDDMDYYQYMSKMGLKYFYLRNNIYIEKLSLEDIEKIINLTDEELNNPSQEIKELIERTYPIVIDYASEKGLQGISCYGPDSPRFWIDSSELVFGFIFDEVADNGLGQDEEWFQNNLKQRAFLSSLFKAMKVKSSEITDKNINVLWYNEFTISEPVLRK